MKRFLIKIAFFCIVLFSIDTVAGVVFKGWLKNVTTGSLGKDNYICDYCNEDVLIFGSSRAELHYNAKLIEDSLGFSTFNCGANGSGIILSYGRLLMVNERYSPKLVVLEITPEFDIIEGWDNKKDLQDLRRHYERAGIPQIFESVDKMEKYKMYSNLYRYNSDFAHNPLRLFSHTQFNRNGLGVQGFLAQNESFDSLKVKKRIHNETFKVDSLKLYYLERFTIEAKKNSKLVYVLSPYYNGRDSVIFDSVRMLSEKYSVPLFDFTNSLRFLHNKDYFKDGVHLNAQGADLFSQEVIKKLKFM